jgi:hypothetical protein
MLGCSARAEELSLKNQGRSTRIPASQTVCVPNPAGEGYVIRVFLSVEPQSNKANKDIKSGGQDKQSTPALQAGLFQISELPLAG